MPRCLSSIQRKKGAKVRGAKECRPKRMETQSREGEPGDWTSMWSWQPTFNPPVAIGFLRGQEDQAQKPGQKPSLNLQMSFLRRDTRLSLGLSFMGEGCRGCSNGNHYNILSNHQSRALFKMLCGLTHFIFTTTLRVCIYYPHFVDKDIKAQRGQVMFTRSHRR